MQTLIDQSGLVAEGDYLSLSKTLTVKDNVLFDKVVGARHQLHPRASKLVKLLEYPIPVELWCQYARRQGINRDGVWQLLLFLNSIGALEIKRSIKGQVKAFFNACRKLRYGKRPIKRSRRWPTNLVNTNQATLIAMLPLVWTTLITAALAYGANIDAALIAAGLSGFLSAIWLSTVIHEQTHSWVIAKQTTRHALMQRGLRLGLLHYKVSKKVELVSALSGPITGALASITYGTILTILSGLSLFESIGGLVAIFQLVSLLPNYGDGQVVWSNLRGIL